MKLKQVVVSVASAAAVLLVIVALFALGSDVIATAPDHAIVFFDSQQQVYYAPVCAPQGFNQTEFRRLRSEMGGEKVWDLLVKQYPDRFKKSTAGEVRKISSSPEHDCTEKGAFVQSQGIPIYLLRSMGLWPKQSRWNNDGTWNFDNSLW